MSVVPFPGFKRDDVPASLTQLARQIEAGQLPTTRVLVCIEKLDGTVDFMAAGTEFSRAHAVGLLRYCEREIMDA